MGDFRKQQLEEWYHQYHEEIFRYIFMLIGDREKAKDLTHDTFLKAYKSIHSFQQQTSDKNWLYKIARNTTIDETRRKKPLQYVMGTFQASSSSTKTPEEIVTLGENEAEVYRSLRSLKRSYQEVIILRKIKELSTKETAEILGWKESKVKVNLHRGLEALRKQMVKEGYEREPI